MNKSELIQKVAGQTELSNAKAGKAVDAVIQSIVGSLKNSEQVVIAGFGTFSVKNRAARMGRNPQTNEPMQIKAARVPAFKAGKALKEAVR